uniref:Uncharacterized protein n=1 Tax=Romanomermis culicivorax TaxID=13658 RepID=A0A915JZ39_ROMCU
MEQKFLFRSVTLCRYYSVPSEKCQKGGRNRRIEINRKNRLCLNPFTLTRQESINVFRHSVEKTSIEHKKRNFSLVFSTNAGTLQNFDHPFSGPLLMYHVFTKPQATFSKTAASPSSSQCVRFSAKYRAKAKLAWPHIGL